MDKISFETYLEQRYYHQMNYYSKASAHNQKKYRRYQWTLIILSAITPVLAALNGKPITIGGTTHNWDLQVFVVIVSAVVAILTTGLKTFNYQEIWINYRSTYERLKPEIYYYTFNIGPYSGDGIDKESLFVTRVETILDAEHKEWPPAKTLQENKTGTNNGVNSSKTKTDSNADQFSNAKENIDKKN